MAVRRGERPRRAGRTPDRSGDAGSVPPAAEAILGLLSLAEAADGGGDGYGYDLARQFGAGQPLAEIIHLEPGMLYHHLESASTKPAGSPVRSNPRAAAHPPGLPHHLDGAGGAEALADRAGRPHPRDPARVPGQALFCPPPRSSTRRTPHRRTARDLPPPRRLPPHPARAPRCRSAPEQASGDWRFVRDVLALRLAQTEAAVGWLEGVQQLS